MKVADERLRDLNFLLDLHDVASTEDAVSASFRAPLHDRLNEGYLPSTKPENLAD